ncbi:hypothetical protein [Sinorhizobium meliloti]|uniref:hypothetical protein n=1 Tax=Rhizobium meliloti TaxID=382 RepID=UPI001F42988C
MPERVRLHLSLLVVIFAATGICAAQGAGPVPSVLILYPYDERVPATNIVGEAARILLVEATSGKIEVFSKFLGRQISRRDRLSVFAQKIFNQIGCEVTDVITTPHLTLRRLSPGGCFW